MHRHVPALSRTAFAFVALAASLLFAAAPARAQVNIPSNAAYACDFEASYCDFTEQSKIEPGRRSSFATSAASGTRGVKLTTLPGDNSVHGSGTWERNDLSKGPDGSYCNAGQEEWWAFSIMFPDDYVFPPGPEAGILMDFHHNASSGQANYEIQTIPGVGLRARGYGGAAINSGKYDALIPDPYGAPTGTVARNVWYHFVLHVRWSPNADGLMEGWVNGKRYQSYQGPTLYSGIACYFKLANYHAAFGQASSVVYDRVVRGGAATAVSALTLEGVGNAPIGSTPGTTPAGTYTLSTVTVGSGNGTVISSPSAINCGSTCSSTFSSGANVTLAASPASGSTFAGWSGACTGTGSCTVGMTAAKSVTATFNAASSASGGVAMSATSVGFGGASGTRTVTYTNNTTSKVTFIKATMSSAKFSQTNNCGDVAVGASCTATITYSPGNSGSDPGTLTITSSAPNSPHVVTLSGAAAATTTSLVPHFYQAILRRAPDAGGQAFWESELARMTSLGAGASEVWFAMSSAFFAGTEYAALRRDNTGYVNDLYAAFMNRAADASGLAYWTGLLAQGMPRDVLLVQFMFSPEFAAFAGSSAKSARAETDVALDFYRGLLARLPDSSGFSFWVSQFRAAQCQGAAAVAAQADAMSGSFANGPEAGARGRNNAQFVGDLYNAFLRRGGDLTGVRFWIQQLDSGTQSRDAVRRAFLASPEFAGRVQAMVAAGCAG